MRAGRGFSIGFIALAEVAALGLWFSASAVVPALKAEAGIDSHTASLFTSAVQFGFVLGTLASAALGLADRLDPRRFFMAATLLASAANALILVLDPSSPWVIFLRLVTGIAMAGIYPVGMKLATTWARAGDMGLMVGLIVGALTLGSAVPHFLNGLGGLDWRLTIAGASIVALGGALAISVTRIGPNYARSPKFRMRFALHGWTRPSLRLANLGYLGHMWELYAMWAWIGVFLDASFRLGSGDPETAGVRAAFATFATIAAGGVGCVIGGVFADRWGRTTLTIAAMATSGACAIAAGFLFGGNPILLVALCLVWGVAIVADSPQFSAAVAELSEKELVGTMLTMQTSLGFLLTLVTIQLVPVLVDLVGWHYAFVFLAPGPFLGVLAMWRLRRHPDSARLANGRR
ncbi:MFS transporter [Oceanibacterium hippocampi]|uniref:Major Facilitator Superfamily protein n=1 Tax=Oceanibacterium hippocampi TaxID=745714 RepID=A0A1Y5RXX4_9PROT|nr:MFS transporter [Oceanibacterium hippocampi]SLN27533.1 Major Facilitator Superfamily protein [Oceanibacterium hippocampi]